MSELPSWRLSGPCALTTFGRSNGTRRSPGGVGRRVHGESAEGVEPDDAQQPGPACTCVAWWLVAEALFSLKPGGNCWELPDMEFSIELLANGVLEGKLLSALEGKLLSIPAVGMVGGRQLLSIADLA